MDFELNAEQRAWQSKARAFAEEEIRPLSLAREAIADPVKTFDWEIIKKGSRLGFRTARPLAAGRPGSASRTLGRMCRRSWSRTAPTTASSASP